MSRTSRRLRATTSRVEGDGLVFGIAAKHRFLWGLQSTPDWAHFEPYVAQGELKESRFVFSESEAVDTPPSRALLTGACMDSSTDELRRRRPLAGLPPRDRQAIYSSSGMHSPNADMRTDADAFELRSDVNVEDACITALGLIRSAASQLELLGMTPELRPAFRDVVEGIACLCRLASGSIAVVHAALCDLPPPESETTSATAPETPGTSERA